MEKTIIITLEDKIGSTGFGISLQGTQIVEALGMLQVAKQDLLNALNKKEIDVSSNDKTENQNEN